MISIVLIEDLVIKAMPPDFLPSFLLSLSLFRKIKPNFTRSICHI